MSERRDVARRWEGFGQNELPLLSCRDLAVLKAYFDRTKNLVDLEEMQAAGQLDVEAVLGVLVNHLGGDDGGDDLRVERLRRVARIPR